MAYVHVSVDYMTYLILRVLAKKLDRTVSEIAADVIVEYIKNRFGDVYKRCEYCMYVDEKFECLEKCIEK